MIATQSRSLFRASSTINPLDQCADSVIACVEFWNSPINPDEVYGRFIGYGGSGRQEEGCFKLIRNIDVLFLSHDGSRNRWDWISSSATHSFGYQMSDTDLFNITDDIISVMDPTDQESNSIASPVFNDEQENDWINFTKNLDCTVFHPFTLACMNFNKRYWSRWEGVKDDSCLRHISKLWSLSFTF